MAYLTEYSFRQLIQRIKIEDLDRIDKQFFKSNIFDNGDLFYFFNQFDLKRLFIEKVVLSDDKSYVLAYQEVPQRRDNLNYVLEIKGKVRYHKNSKCEALNRGFQNFYMPDPVVRIEKDDPEKHVRVVSAIRDWFDRNNYTVERYLNDELNDKLLTADFNKTFPKKFEIDPIFISQSDKGQFKWFIEKKTSGLETVEKSYKSDILQFEVLNLIENREKICNGSALKNLSRYDFLFKKEDAEIEDYIFSRIDNGYLRGVNKIFLKNYRNDGNIGIDALRVFWEKHAELKKQAFNLLSDYFKWSYNYSEKDFDEIFLENFNLAACSLCYGNEP